MIILVCGGRDIGQIVSGLTGADAARQMSRATHERRFISNYLNKIHEETPISHVICGNEGGAERVGLNWAEINRIPVSAWSRLKIRKTGFISSLRSLGGKSASKNYTRETIEARNTRMLEGSAPDLVVAFGGGDSTKLLLEDARRRGLKVIEIVMPESESS